MTTDDGDSAGREDESAAARPDGGLGEVGPTGTARELANVPDEADKGMAEADESTATDSNDAFVDDVGHAATVPMAIASFARREYRVAARSRWPVGLATLFAVFTLGVVQYGASGAGTSTIPAVVASVAALSTYVVPLAALAFGYATVVGPRQRGELDVLHALPVPRWTVIVGAFLGRGASFAGAVLIGYGIGAAALFRVGGTVAVRAFLPTVAAAVLAGLAFLALAVLVSTVAREKAHALGVALVAWAWFVLLHDLAALTAVVVVDLPASALAVLVAANPADCLRVLGMAGVPTAGGAAGALGATDLSVPIVVLALLAWTAVAVGIAGVTTTRTD